MSGRNIYKKHPNDYSPPLNEAIKVTDPPKHLYRERKKFLEAFSTSTTTTTPLPLRRLHQPLNVVDMPTYREYDPMAFKYIREMELKQDKNEDESSFHHQKRSSQHSIDTKML